MKLFELVGYKKYQDMKFYEILKSIASDPNNKFETSTGAFAITIIPEDKPYVYKIWYEDNAYDEYIKLVLKLQGNPFVPKIYGSIKHLPMFFKRPKQLKNPLKIVKIEKLKYVPDSDINFGFERIMSDVIDKDSYFYDAPPEELKKHFLGLIDRKTKLALQVGLKKEHINHLVKLSRALVSLVKRQPKFNSDISGDNILQRDKFPVLSDPFAMEAWYKDTIRIKHVAGLEDIPDERRETDSKEWVSGKDKK